MQYIINLKYARSVESYSIFFIHDLELATMFNKVYK